VWGRLQTCGRLQIGPAGYLRIFGLSPHSQLVTTFHKRRLPHYHPIGQPVFLTWRLHGSLPRNRAFPPATTAGEAFLAMDRLLDNARTGPMFLRQREIATVVVSALRYRDQGLGHFRLHSYVVMPNHVHVLVTPNVPVSKLMQSLKKYTARECNRILGLTGQPFWQDESYDRAVRDEREFRRITRYIEMNPVKAGLASGPEEFPWSSAGADLQSAAGFTTCPTRL